MHLLIGRLRSWEPPIIGDGLPRRRPAGLSDRVSASLTGPDAETRPGDKARETAASREADGRKNDADAAAARETIHESSAKDADFNYE